MSDAAAAEAFCELVHLDHLHLFQDFVLSKAKEMSVPELLHLKLELVVEELVVNVCHYGYPDGEGNLEMRCFLEQDVEHSRFCVRLRDWGIPFNPLSKAKPNTELSITDRPIGGLGIFLAEELTDSISYQRKDDCNVLTFGINV